MVAIDETSGADVTPLSNAPVEELKVSQSRSDLQEETRKDVVKVFFQ